MRDDTLLYKARPLPADISQQKEAMIRDILMQQLYDIGKKARQNPSDAELDALRESNQVIFQLLRRLQNRIAWSRRHIYPSYPIMTLGTLLLHLARACDLLLIGSGKRLVYLPPETADTCRPALDWPLFYIAVMNLIANAIQFAQPLQRDLILRYRQTEEAFLLTLEQCGRMQTKPPLHPAEDPGGISVARHIAQLHGGRLIYRQQKERMSVTLSFPHHLPRPNQQGGCKEGHSFTDLFCDRFSPLYVGLCDCFSPPLD